MDLNFDDSLAVRADIVYIHAHAHWETPLSCMFIDNALTDNAAQRSDSPSMSRSLIYLVILTCCLEAIILCHVW